MAVTGGTTDVNNYGVMLKILAPVSNGTLQVMTEQLTHAIGGIIELNPVYGLFFTTNAVEQITKIVCHSAGCYATDYFLSKYGFVTDSYDVNISYTLAAASASGGSELADLAFWESNSMVAALKTGTARSFNHNVSGGVASYHVAGFVGDWYASWRLAGEDDGAVAFHTTCGKSAGSYDDCNATDPMDKSLCFERCSEAGYSSGKQAIDTDSGVKTSVQYV